MTPSGSTAILPRPNAQGRSRRCHVNGIEQSGRIELVKDRLEPTLERLGVPPTCNIDSIAID